MVGFIPVVMCSFDTSSCFLGFRILSLSISSFLGPLFFLPDFPCFTFFFVWGGKRTIFGEYMDHLRRTFNEKLRHSYLVEAKRDLGDRMIVTFPDPIGESKSNSTNDCLLTRILLGSTRPTRMPVTDPKYYCTFPYFIVGFHDVLRFTLYTLRPLMMGST